MALKLSNITGNFGIKKTLYSEGDLDALAEFGITHLDMPCTPERIWAALTAARAGVPLPVWSEPPAVFTAAVSTTTPIDHGAGDVDI